MSKIIQIFQLRMLPAGSSLGLLTLRLGFGLSLLLLHGWSKVTGFSAMAPKFSDPWGLGGETTLALLVFAEVGGSGLVVLGLLTRFGALICACAMACAWYYGHDLRLTGPENGELAFLYLLGFLTVLLAGPGRFAFDSWVGNTAKKIE